METGSDYFQLSESDLKLSDIQKQSILSCIENSGNQLGGVSYNIIDPVIRKYALYVYVKMKSQKLDKEYIKNQIKVLVGDFFANIQSDMYIPKSDIVMLIKNNIEAVDSVDVYFLSERNETAMRMGYYVDDNYTWNPSTGTYDSHMETVYLYSGQNPSLGLDGHGNICLESNNEFPVLMGGWEFTNDSEELQSVQAEAITITVE